MKISMINDCFKYSMIVVWVFIMSGMINYLHAQDKFICGTQQMLESSSNVDLNDGKYITAHDTIRILVVFAKFPETSNGPSYWPSDGFPTFATNTGSNAFIDGSINQNSNHFINLTNYYRQMSIDNFIVLGDVEIVEADKSFDQFSSRSEANRHILQKLDNTVDFSKYDNWTNIDDYDHQKSADGIVDMIAMIWRGQQISSYDGEASLGGGGTLEVDNGNTEIKFGFPNGSGFTIQARTSVKKSLFINTIHEMAHWLLGAPHPYLTQEGPIHRIWSMLQSSLSSAASANTFERDRLGWINAVEITQNTTGQLGDFINTGEAYVYHPDNGETNEFYYIENHQDISIYDDATKNSGDKGLFILHQKNVYSNEHNIRHLSSDGDYQWKQNGTVTSPYDPDSMDQLPIFKKDIPDALNGLNYGDKMTTDQGVKEWLFAFETESGDVLTEANFQGEPFVGSFTPDQEPTFSDLTNPRADTWLNNEETGFAFEVKEQVGNDLVVDFFTDNDPYVIKEMETVKWAGPVSLERNVVIKEDAHLIIGNHGSSKEFHVTIPDSVTITVESGGKFTMQAGGGIGSRTYFTNKGTFISKSNSEFIMGDHTWFFNEGTANINVSPQLGTGSEIFGLDGQMSFAKAVNLSNPESCIAINGGAVHFQQEASFSNGAFLMSFESGGTFKADQSITVYGGGNDSGYAIDLTPGTNIEMGFNERITVEQGASMRAVGTPSNPIRFTYQYPSEWPDGAWDEIRLRGDGNRFEHVVFEYGLQPLNIRSRDNIITHSTFKNNDTGIYSTTASSGERSQFKLVDSKVSGNSENGVVVQYADASIEYSELSGNGDSGLYVRSATVGDGSSSGSGGFFQGNHIHSNSGYGIYLLNNATVRNGQSFWKGKNKITDNGSHEIYLGSSTSRWFNGIDGGFSWIEDNDNNKYIYNLAQSFNGEFYVSWTVPAENNYWGTSSGPSSDDFFGPVDYSPYLSRPPFQNAGPRDPGTPSKARSEGPTVVASVMSAGQARAYTAKSSSPEAAQQRLWIEQRMLELKNAIAKAPREKEVARRLNGLYYLWRQLPEQDRGQKPYVQETIRRYSDALWQASPPAEGPAAHADADADFDRPAADGRPGVDKATSLTGQTAMILEINHRLLEGQTEKAEEIIGEYRPYLTNLDMRRELLMARLSAYEQQGNYEQAFAMADDLQELGRFGIDTEHSGQEYGQLRASLKAVLAEQTGGESGLGDQQNPAETAGANPTGNPSLQQDTNDLPASFELSSAYPNPFNPSTQVPFALPEAAEVRVEVYSVTGRLVAVLANSRFEAGRHTLVFNASGLASGVYLVRARLGQQVQTRKITLVK